MKGAVWHKCFLFVLFGLKCEERTINLRQTFLPAVCESLLWNEREERLWCEAFLSTLLIPRSNTVRERKFWNKSLFVFLKANKDKKNFSKVLICKIKYTLSLWKVALFFFYLGKYSFQIMSSFFEKKNPNKLIWKGIYPIKLITCANLDGCNYWWQLLLGDLTCHQVFLIVFYVAVEQFWPNFVCRIVLISTRLKHWWQCPLSDVIASQCFQSCVSICDFSDKLLMLFWSNFGRLAAPCCGYWLPVQFCGAPKS